MAADTTKSGGLKNARGPVAGKGRALPDSEALKILDERPQDDAPDIGVVIDPEPEVRPPSQQRLLPPGPKAEPISLGHLYGASWREQENLEWEPFLAAAKASKWLVRAESMQTPISYVLDCSLGSHDPEWWDNWQSSQVIFIRLLSSNSRIDLACPRYIVERPGTTLQDLLRLQDR
ncbi:MAG TPA: hypothetical protein VGI73_11300 [Solirubrobacterales bacterium]|jgi:hypothetical protein